MTGRPQPSSPCKASGEDDDSAPIYNEPADFDEAECEAKGREDRIAGVRPVDGPYVAGLPCYAWERGYYGE